MEICEEFRTGEVRTSGRDQQAQCGDADGWQGGEDGDRMDPYVVGIAATINSASF